MFMMRILSADEVRSALPMRDAIDAMREGFIALSSGKATVPVRAAMSIPSGVMLYMPAYINGEPISTVKVVSVIPGNAERGLPVVNASVMVMDAETGLPVALLDGTSLTAIRTGAGSGLATDLLARENARILGVIGAGAQARTQIEAVCTVRDIKEIRVYSPHSAAQLADELRGQYEVDIIFSSSAHDAAYGADVIVAATNSKTPVITAADIAPGTHINGVGSFTPDMQEIPADIVTMARIVVDHRESVWEEAGDLIIPRDQGLITEDNIYAELGEIAAGKLAGRQSDDEITFFKSVGNAVQDAAAAARVLKAAAV
jgi:ornithine cyclodeaminase/alanine dehydrogenase-like protein (mu-crystallin family)